MKKIRWNNQFRSLKLNLFYPVLPLRPTWTVKIIQENEIHQRMGDIAAYQAASVGS